MDVVSFRSAGAAGRSDAIPLDAALAFATAAQRLLVAAARACGPAPRPHYGQANRSLVRRSLAAARLGSAAGLDGLTLEVHLTLPDPADEAAPTLLPAADVGPPLERLVSLRLLEAVEAATAAAERHESSGDLDEFRHHLEAGVSADLCDAACALLDAGGDVEVLVEPAPSLPVGGGTPTTTSAKLHLRHRPVLEAAARELRADHREIEAQLSGRVTELGGRVTIDGPGTVTLQVLDPDPPARTVKVRVGPQRYDDAIVAHRANRSIAVRGTLVRQGVSHWIHSPVSFRVGPELAVDGDGAPTDEPLPFEAEPTDATPAGQAPAGTTLP